MGPGTHRLSLQMFYAVVDAYDCTLDGGDPGSIRIRDVSWWPKASHLNS